MAYLYASVPGPNNNAPNEQPGRLAAAKTWRAICIHAPPLALEGTLAGVEVEALGEALDKALVFCFLGVLVGGWK